MSIEVYQKGLSVMHDIPLTQVQAEGYLPQIQPRSPSLAQHLVQLLQQVLVFAHERTALQTSQSRSRGRPPLLPWQQLYLALLMGVLQQTSHLSTIWRRLYLEEIGSFAPVQVTYEAVRKRLLSAGTSALAQLFETVSVGLAQWSQALQLSALSLAPFASQVVALDESTFDRLRRLTSDLRDVPAGDPHLLPGKLAGLFDLGYFSFPWFDYLTGQGYWWVSRLKDGVTYEIKEVVAYDDRSGLLDAIVWLGKYRADRAASAVRLVCFSFHGTQYRYLTNVLDSTQLSLRDIAQLYARRWDIELAFKLLKCSMPCSCRSLCRPRSSPLMSRCICWSNCCRCNQQALHLCSLAWFSMGAHSDSFVPPAVSPWSCQRLSHTCSVRPLISRTSSAVLAMPNATLIPDTLLSSLASQLNF